MLTPDQRLAQEFLATADSLAYCLGCVEELIASAHPIAREWPPAVVRLHAPDLGDALRRVATLLHPDCLTVWTPVPPADGHAAHSPSPSAN